MTATATRPPETMSGGNGPDSARAIASRRSLPGIGITAALLPAAIALGQITSHVYGRGTVPASFLIDATIRGLVAALFAVGLLLVYRSARIINFAHGSIAFAALIVSLSLLGMGWSWWLVAPTAVLVGVAAGVLVEVTLLRRFTNSPRLVATVASIAAGQVIASAVFILPQWRYDVDFFAPVHSDDLVRLPQSQLHAPFAGHFHRKTAAIVFTGDHIFAAVMAIVALLAVFAFLRYSRAGTAIRAVAENTQRAMLLGIGTATLSTLVWAIAGGLAGLGALLTGPLENATLVSTVVTGGGSAAGLLLQGLAAAVIGRMTDLSRTIVAAVAIGIFGRCVFWATGQTALEDIALLLVIGIALVVQRGSLSRVDESATSAWAAAEEVRGVPAVLRALPVVQSGRRFVIALLAIVVFGYPFAMSPSQVYTGSTYVIFGIVAVSLVVLVGWGGQISLGQFALVAVGACVGGALTANAHLPFPLAALIASLVGAGVAILLGLPALRIRGLYLAVTTLAFAAAMRSFVLDHERFPWLTPGKVNRPKIGFLDFKDERAFYFLCIFGLAVALAMALSLRHTRTGRVLIAMRENERAAQSFGISLMRTRLATFAISGFIAAWAGVLLVNQSHAVRPESFGAQQSVNMFLVAVIGGLGSVSGVLTGALYLGTVNVFVHGDIGKLLAAGVGVLVIILAFPAGLGGVVYSIRDAWLRRVALREKIFVRSLLGDVRDLSSERTRAPLTPKPEPEPVYELVDSDVRHAGASQRARGWVYG